MSVPAWDRGPRPTPPKASRRLRHEVLNHAQLPILVRDNCRISAKALRPNAGRYVTAGRQCTICEQAQVAGSFPARSRSDARGWHRHSSGYHPRGEPRGQGIAPEGHELLLRRHGTGRGPQSLGPGLPPSPTPCSTTAARSAAAASAPSAPAAWRAGRRPADAPWRPSHWPGRRRPGRG